MDPAPRLTRCGYGRDTCTEPVRVAHLVRVHHSPTLDDTPDPAYLLLCATHSAAMAEHAQHHDAAHDTTPARRG